MHLFHSNVKLTFRGPTSSDIFSFRDLLSANVLGEPIFRLNQKTSDVVSGMAGKIPRDTIAVNTAINSPSNYNMREVVKIANRLLKAMKKTEHGIAGVVFEGALFNGFVFGGFSYLVASEFLKSVADSNLIPPALFFFSFAVSSIVSYLSYVAAKTKFLKCLKALAPQIRDGINESERMDSLFILWLEGGNPNPLIRDIIEKAAEGHDGSLVRQFNKLLLEEFFVPETLDSNFPN